MHIFTCEVFCFIFKTMNTELFGHFLNFWLLIKMVVKVNVHFLVTEWRESKYSETLLISHLHWTQAFKFKVKELLIHSFFLKKNTSVGCCITNGYPRCFWQSINYQRLCNSICFKHHDKFSPGKCVVISDDGRL